MTGVFLCLTALLITNASKANTAMHSRAKTTIEISCVYRHIQSHSLAKLEFDILEMHSCKDTNKD